MLPLIWGINRTAIPLPIFFKYFKSDNFRDFWWDPNCKPRDLCNQEVILQKWDFWGLLMGSKVQTTWPGNSCVRARQHKYFVRQGKAHLPTCRKIWQVTWFWLWIPSNVPKNLTFAIFYKITSWFRRSRGLQFGSHQKSPNISLLKYFIPGLSKSNFIIKCNRGQLQGVEQRSIEVLVNILRVKSW